MESCLFTMLLPPSAVLGVRGERFSFTSSPDLIVKKLVAPDVSEIETCLEIFFTSYH